MRFGYAYISVFLILIFLTCSCQSSDVTQEAAGSETSIEEQNVFTEEDTSEPTSSYSLHKRVRPHDDVRDLSVLSNQSVNQGINCFFEEGEYNPEDIPTLRYNMGTVFEGNERLAEEILEQGKNPGLGIRKLHEQGLTGKGINIGIIDSSLILKHPEYEGKIADYYDINIENAEIGPMHGAAITSILVGSEIGIIPDAKVYYVATETGMKADSQDVADGIYWIMEQNKSLPDHQKIRIISISDDPAEMGCINREAYIKARDAATSEVC